jgi:dTDP-4-amino-4,6-dideoxygalactose transaminase
LYAQLQSLSIIQERRKRIWTIYNEYLSKDALSSHIRVNHIPNYGTNNAHMFYVVCKTPELRTELIAFLKEKGVMAVFHYQSLHNSQFMHRFNNRCDLPMADYYSDRLLRLPLFYELNDIEVLRICGLIEQCLMMYAI